MSGLSRTPGKRVYGESRTVGSNPTLSAIASIHPRTGGLIQAAARFCTCGGMHIAATNITHDIAAST